MKRTIAIKLNLSQIEAQALSNLAEVFSSACNQAASIAFREKENNRIRLHHLCYKVLRKKFPELGSQMCCNAIAKTSQALKALKRPREILFKRGCSVYFDKRTYSLKGQILSLFTLQKRIRIQLEISPFHQSFLNQGKIKEAELVCKGKRYFFHLVLDFPDVQLTDSNKAMAVDLVWRRLSSSKARSIFGA